MANFLHLESLSSPRLEAYRNLQDAARLQRENRFITEGRHVTERLLLSDHETESLLISESRLENLREDLACDIPASVPVFVLPEPAIQELVGFPFHRGILGCGIRKSPLPLEAILDPAPEPQLIVICPDIGQAENLGQIIRSSRALGAGALLLGESCCDPLSRRALRVSMGNALFLPIRSSTDLMQDLTVLKMDWEVELVGTTLDEDALSLPETRLGSRVGLIFGNEARGLRPEVKAACDHLVTIPMQGGTDSLNVGVAAGIFLYQLAHRELLG